MQSIEQFRIGYLLLQLQHFYAHNAFYIPYLVSTVIVGIVFIFLVFIFRKIWNVIRYLQEESVFLELTPPAFTEKTAYTTQQLFSVLHNISSQQTILKKILGVKTYCSLEIVSTKDQGIRYLVRTNRDDAKIIEQSILSYLPFIRVKRVEDYLHNKVITGHKKIVEFRLKKHFAFPLAKQNVLNQHDPVAYITGMMTKLRPEECIALQIVLTPTKTRETEILAQKILRNDDVLDHLLKLRFPSSLVPFVFVIKFFAKIIHVIASECLWLIHELMHSNARQMKYAYEYDMTEHLRISKQRPVRVLSGFEEEIVASVQKKIDQELFETTLSVLVVQNEKTELLQRVKGLKAALAPFSVPKFQSLQALSNFPPVIADKIRLVTFRRRLLSTLLNASSSLLSVSEIADLYHFPYSQTTQTENIVKIHSKILSAPLSLKNNPKFDVVFAKNTYAGTETFIGLTKEERVRHMYVIGATGTGKSTMLLSMIAQDLKNGKGLCLIDPHGDLAQSALNCIPEERIKDLIYFNPVDIKYPIGVNLLELTPGLDDNESLIEKEFIAESVISLFRKMFSEVGSAHPHRIEYILRNTIHTAFTLDNPTLFTIFDLLSNPPFQKKALAGLTDENLKNFWKYEFGKAGDFQKVKMVSPVTARIGRFLFSPSAKRILEQERSTINFDEILATKKILICNLAKGNIGEDTSEVMGIMLLNKIQLAALKRARMAQKERTNFYLYVDEFQNFATPSFVQMLSEARKYGLNLTMAEQSTSQQKDKNLVQIVLANTGTIVTFRSANPNDEELLLPQYRPYVTSGEITNLPSFHFYMKTAAMSPEEPFSGVTIPQDVHLDKEKQKQCITSSRNLYAIEYKAKKHTSISHTREEGRKIDKKTGKSKFGLPV